MLSVYRPLRIQQRNVILASTLSFANYMLFGQQNQLADSIANPEKLTKYQLPKRKVNYPGHVHLNPVEKTLLFTSSAVQSFLHPENGMNIVNLGESTAFTPFLENLKTTMLSDPTGRRILREQPHITEQQLNMEKLASYPKDSVGYTFYHWCRTEKVTPDTRAEVKYIDDPIHAYIFKRFRQCHDFYHSLVNMPIIIEGEITVKALEGANMGVPMAIMGSIFAPLRLKEAQRKRLREIYLPWAWKTGLSCKPLINVYWEEQLERNVDELRKELGIVMPPNLREMRKKAKAERAALKQKYSL